MTYEEYVEISNHECNYFCQSRATHAEIVYTDELHSRAAMMRGLARNIGHAARIDDIRPAPEAEDWVARSTHHKLYHYGMTSPPKESEHQVKWLMIFTLWGEIKE